MVGNKGLKIVKDQLYGREKTAYSCAPLSAKGNSSCDAWLVIKVRFVEYIQPALW